MSLLFRILPGLTLLRGYQRQWLLSDCLAGLSVCLVMIPSVLAYAGLMGLPLECGLYAALVPLIVYPLLGSSRQLIVGPDIAIVLLIASAVIPLSTNPAHAVALAGMIGIVGGFLLLVGSWIKVGAVADFFSKPILVGYMTGAALILMVSQLDKLFGVKLSNRDFFPRLYELAGKLQFTHYNTLILGLLILVSIIGVRHFSKKIPPALLAVCVALFVSWAFKLPATGVAVVGTFPHSLPKFQIPTFSWHELHAVFPAAIGIALLTYTEAILLARAFGAKNKYEVNPNAELKALGVVNIVTGLFQGFSVTGSQSRTVIADSAGSKTQITSWVAAITLVLFLLFFTPVIALLPAVTLAAILIYGGFTLIEFGVMNRIYKMYPYSGFLAALTALGVLVVGVIPGILVGVAFSLLGLINKLSFPPDAVLKHIEGDGYHDTGEKSGDTIPGLIAFRFYAPLLFSNCNRFSDRVRFLVANAPTPVKCFLLDAQAITDIDITAAETLIALHHELIDKGISVKIAHTNKPLRDVFTIAGISEDLTPGSFYHSVHEGIEAFQA